MSALIFDCDGVLADTERYGHLPAFNQTFEEFGLPVHWSEEEYGRLLQIGGGKERMATLLTPEFVAGGRAIPRSRGAGGRGRPLARPQDGASIPRWWRPGSCGRGPASRASSKRRSTPAGGSAWPRPPRRRRFGPSSSTSAGPDGRPLRHRPRRRRGAPQEAGAGHLSAGPRATGGLTPVPRSSSSRTPATALAAAAAGPAAS